MKLVTKKIFKKIKLIKDDNTQIVSSGFITKKQIKILEEVNSGKILSMDNIKIPPHEYLYKDIQGITFLEHLLNNGIYVNTFSLKSFKEAAYVFCKCDQELFGFSLTEEQLFSNINGVRLIDFIIEKNKLTFEMIRSIKSNIEIIDLIILSKSFYLLNYISDEIKDKLMIQDSNGIYIIEKYIDNEVVMNNLIPVLNKPKQLIDVCEKYNKKDLLKYATPEILMYNIDKNYTVLQYLLSNNIIPISLLFIRDDKRFIDYLREQNLYKYLLNADESVFLMKVDNKKTLLEEIIEKIDIKKIKCNITDKKTIQILYKKNKLNIDIKINEKILAMPVTDIINVDSSFKNHTLLEYMLDNGYQPLESLYSISNEDIIKILYNRKKYKILGQKLNEQNLLLQMENGKTLIDELIENNIEIGFTGFESNELLKKFYEKDRIDLLTRFKIEKLYNLVEVEKTYFDCVLENIKSKKIKFNLNGISFYGCSANTVAKFYLYLAKYDMLEYVKSLKKQNLLKEYKGKTLLDELLDLNYELTFNKILSDDVKSEIEVAIILKSRGLDQKDIDVPLLNKNFDKEYLDDFNRRLGIGPLPYEGEALLSKLSKLFLSDGKSDPSLVSSLIIGYRQALFSNYELYIKELKNIISVKEKNKSSLVYLKEEDGSFFRSYSGTVHSDNIVVDTLMHETGHALHSYLSSEKIPKNYEEIIKKTRENKRVIENVERFAKEYNKIKNEIHKIVEQKYELFFESYFNEKRKKEISDFLNKSKQEKKEEFKFLNLSESILYTILENSFTSEEYINHQKRLFIQENSDAIFRSEFGALMAIGDILDAIYEGELHSEVLKNVNGEAIPPTAGHGISYYYDSPEKAFSEMIANFTSISKSKNSNNMLDLLKSIVGEELYNMLNNFYNDNIIKYKKIQKKK